MKKEVKWIVKPLETNFETDIDDSYPQWSISHPLWSSQKKKKGKKIQKNKIQKSCYQRVLRLQLKHLGRTLRVPCYSEEGLNLPLRFTRKLNAMEVDNDLETDQEVVEGQIQRCCGWLKDAALAYKSTEMTDN